MHAHVHNKFYLEWINLILFLLRFLTTDEWKSRCYCAISEQCVILLHMEILKSLDIKV